MHDPVFSRDFSFTEVFFCRYNLKYSSADIILDAQRGILFHLNEVNFIKIIIPFKEKNLEIL